MAEIAQNQVVTETAVNQDEEKKENIVNVDFRMVAFSLAGKDYAIDIMNIKEIVKGGRYTYVPNTAPFVLGVYNLRGDIIPIIDLRLFFNIEVPEKKAGEIENMIIVTVEDKTFGVVVDEIDKVLGIQKSSIQPPHPLFGDINIKFIYGVVECNNRLYVLLDVARIFTNKPRDDGDIAGANKQSLDGKNINDVMKNNPIARQMLGNSNAPANKNANSASATSAAPKEEKPEELDLGFIKDGLKNLKKFYATDLNENWIKERYSSWAKERGKDHTQLVEEKDAEQYLSNFASPCSNQFWTKEYADAVYACLPDNSAKQIVVWNPGCGKGYESYSLACLFKKRYPDARIRIFAQDMDLLNVSNASLLSVPDSAAESWYKPFVTKSVTGGYSFSQDIKDIVMFEYHDISHTNTVPNPDLIFCRDILSFMPEEVQNTVLLDFEEKLKGNGILVIGENESLSSKINWSEKLVGNICVYTK